MQMKVMIIDREDAAAQMVASKLEASGHTIVFEADKDKAIKHAAALIQQTT